MQGPQSTRNVLLSLSEHNVEHKAHDHKYDASSGQNGIDDEHRELDGSDHLFRYTVWWDSLCVHRQTHTM